MAKANFNLSTFISAIKEDSLARVNRFEVMIPAPLGMSDLNKSYATFSSLYCEMASLPPVNISTKSFKIFGPTYQRPFGAEYGGEGISLIFHVDRDMNVKKFFDEWTAVVVDPDTGLVNYQENYISTINLRQLDEQENVTYELELFEAFPRSVNLLELNNSAQNQTHRLNVLFAYRYWKDKGRDFQTTPMDIPLRRRIPEIPVEDTRLRNVTPTGQFDIGTTNQDMAFGVNGLSG
jgi:hypothetical protein